MNKEVMQMERVIRYTGRKRTKQCTQTGMDGNANGKEVIVRKETLVGASR